jgi:cysteine protease ATG4
MLGKKYTKGKHFAAKKASEACAHKFMNDFMQIAWVTYRSNFRPILNSLGQPITSDQGWGCTIRVAQMMLLTTLKQVSQSVWPDSNLLQSIQEYNERAEFSLHRFVEEGRTMDKNPGDWYSPSEVCFAMERMVNSCATREISVKIFFDGVIYKDQLYEAARLDQSMFESDPQSLAVSVHQDVQWSSFMTLTESVVEERKESMESSIVEPVWERPVLVLLPLMLGLGKLNQDYNSVVKEALEMPGAVGIIGGRPRSALYFVGFQDDNLLFLDPHLVQEACADEAGLRVSEKTYINQSTRMIPFANVESSMAIGFLITSALSLQQLEMRLVENRDSLRGILQVQKTTPEYMKGGGTSRLEFI